jgi:hypothetical protein
MCCCGNAAGTWLRGRIVLYIDGRRLPAEYPGKLRSRNGTSGIRRDGELPVGNGRQAGWLVVDE